MQPKSALGMRAMVEHLVGLQAINPTEPDTNYSILQLFGGTKLAPTLNIHMQAAVRKQQAFETWALDRNAQLLSAQQGQQATSEYVEKLDAVPADGIPDPATGQVVMPTLPPPPSPTQFTPLAWKPWYNPAIHRQEFMKWANSDRMLELVKKNPALEPLLVAHLQDIDIAMAEMQAKLQALTQSPNTQGPKGAAQGGRAMSNSNSESGGSQNASDHTARPQEGV